MGAWKVPMPREEPPENTVDYRVGFKSSGGFRVELDGRVSEEGFKKIARILQKDAVACPRNRRSS